MGTEMDRLLRFYTGGRWVSPVSDATMPVRNPATEERIATLALGNAGDVDRVVAAAKAAFESYATTTRQDRLALLHNPLRVMQERFEDLAQAMRIQMGAPIAMARDAQADAGLGNLHCFINAFEQLEDRQVFGNGDNLVRVPISVCG